jgi:hypothetical protein
MYSYALYGYMVYRLYEYYSILEYALYLGRGSMRAYRWVFPPTPLKKFLGDYSEWVILCEDGEIAENNDII